MPKFHPNFLCQDVESELQHERYERFDFLHSIGQISFESIAKLSSHSCSVFLNTICAGHHCCVQASNRLRIINIQSLRGSCFSCGLLYITFVKGLEHDVFFPPTYF